MAVYIAAAREPRQTTRGEKVWTLRAFGTASERREYMADHPRSGIELLARSAIVRRLRRTYPIIGAGFSLRLEALNENP